MSYIRRFIIIAVVAIMAIAGAAVAFAQQEDTIMAEIAPAARQFGPQNGDNSGLRELLPQIFDKDEMKGVVAEALGITVAELDAAKEAGTRLPELAAELGVDLQTVHDAVQAYRETAVADAVAAGIITAEQGEQILSHSGRFGPGGHGGPGRRGGGQGQPGFGGQPPTPDNA